MIENIRIVDGLPFVTVKVSHKNKSIMVERVLVDTGSAKGSIRFCFECESFPCKRLKALDKCYRTRYHMSMIENLNYIKESGMEEFLKKELDKWRCEECGATICCYNGLCLNCNIDTLLMNKKYRWEEEQND